MVAISLYRGNLHRVPDVPRRWLMPTPKISLKDFRILLNRRSRALSRLHSSTTSSNPNRNPDEEEEKEEERENNDFPNNDSVPPPQSDQPKITTTHPEGEEGDLKEGGICEEEANDRRGSDGGDGPAKLVDGSDASKDAEPEVPQSDANPVDANADLQDEKAPESLENTKAETSTKVDALTDKEMRKKEVEEKLLVLNEKKHNLVQVLKQILNAEEELKRRNSTQGTVIRPAVPLQVDVTNDSGSLTRLATPRLGSEGNLGGDMEGGEADDASNHSMHPRHLPRMSSTSPHSDSPHRRPAFSAVLHPSRASLAVASSPSRFAPTGHQGHPANPPTVSVSGTSYIASSPSPVASGGTSSFRDARLPSPWN
ncbi:Sal-like protein [Actinidia chinensis var. chinensis]|uniref:Sal-like protein n=1 Tax=Actinidia chinensis var. chinensis TaxID=1590841 RepID=A0A2R6PS07_ACTCC|nr:Sal-like protein [Actinidia chinensis var. chinensis]